MTRTRTTVKAAVRASSEHDHQVALFSMIDLHSERYPVLKNVFAVPNQGDRTPRMGAHMVAEGLRAGVPDIFVAVPREPHHGLFVELKYRDNKPTPEQLDWFVRLRREGYLVRVCYDWLTAWETICEYLGIAPEYQVL